MFSFFQPFNMLPVQIPKAYQSHIIIMLQFIHAAQSQQVHEINGKTVLSENW